MAVEKGIKCTEAYQCVNCQNQVTAVEEREDLVYVAVMDCELEDQLWSDIFSRPIRSECKQPIRSELKQPIRSEFKQLIGSSHANRI